MGFALKYFCKLTKKILKDICFSNRNVVCTLMKDKNKNGATVKFAPFLCLFFLFSQGAACATLGFLFSGLFDFNACQFGVDHDTAAVFAYDDFLTCANVELTLRRNLVEATTAGTTLNVNDAQSIARVLTNALEGSQEARLDCLFDVLSLFAKLFFFGFCLGGDVVQTSSCRGRHGVPLIGA